MSRTQQTRSFKLQFILLLLVSLQISLSHSNPLSTAVYQSTPPCDASNLSAECGNSVSPSPAPPRCKAHQSEWDDLAKVETDYKNECGYDKVKEKYLAGTLEQPDLVKCYRPQCDNEQYTIKQCSFLFNEWCWCSTPHGQAIAGTFQKDMPMGFCSTLIERRPHCRVDGKDFDINSIFTPSSICGLCECHSDGTHTCFINYTVDADNQLSDEQLESLKNNLIQVFKLQHNQQTVGVQQIKTISMDSPFEVSEEEKSVVVNSKFIFYDADEDGALNRFEEFNFQNQLGTLFGCTNFFHHLNELMNSNNDGQISLLEWNTFFGVSDVDVSGDSPTQSVLQKREVPLDIRKSLHLRKKFHYLIS